MWIRFIVYERVAAFGGVSAVSHQPPAVGCYEFSNVKERSTQFVRAVSPSGDFFWGEIVFRLWREAVFSQTGIRYEVCFKCQVEVYTETRRP